MFSITCMNAKVIFQLFFFQVLSMFLFSLN
uniref:Uncharacterized protein n=1 Tax=Rhizophora mucronata TaxID=61149 RepID=A0A2P2PS21_RHIMU